MRIAFQGVTGAYSEAAARRFNASADLLARPSFEQVFSAVAEQQATHGILPIENTIGGTIHRNYDLLLEHDLPIVAEVKLAVRHHLIVLEGTTIDQVRRIYPIHRDWRSASDICARSRTSRSSRPMTRPAAPR